jgi:glycosyltransferase involved in cell wall biosynthesis
MPPPLTIGFVSSTFAPLPGGAETYLDHLSHALADRGHAVRVVPRFVDTCPKPFERLLSSHEPARRYEDRGVQVHVLAPTEGRRLLLPMASRLHFYPSTEPVAIRLYETAFYHPLREALRGCDVIHYSGTGRELLGFVAQRIAADTNRPFFVTPHLHVGSWGDSPLDIRLYRQAGGVVALTDYERDAYLQWGIPPHRVHVQGHGVNVSGTGDGRRFRAEAGLGDTPMILFLGRKAGYKGYPMLLESAPEIWGRFPDAHIVFAGPADETGTLPPATKKIATDPRILDYGFVSDDMREDLYAACDLFCLPSTDEAFGLVYLEAGAYGKPVVGLDIPTLRELIGRANSGLLTRPTPTALATTICELLGDPAKRELLGENGRRRAKKQSWAHVAEAMSTLYQNAVVPTTGVQA